ncbi:chorismate mutase [Camelimonas abortus]|uniref:chorismate mutase n=1 Tax=Camelimonas abortus TaxID=1017184 RepID=A0ABV7LF46_9HYPH
MTQPISPEAAGRLAALRAEIDRIDAAMHALLIERSEIIDELIAVKRTGESGSAFRPGREAAMMRAIASRHRGSLPLDTAEGIWRVIIATFTWLQAPFSVHADISSGDGPMRDSARFHFGFTVPYVPHGSAADVIAAVGRSAGDLGIFRADSGRASIPWWEALTAADAPKIIARLPFIERHDHPASTPVFVVSRPLADAAVRETVLYAARVERWRDDTAAAIAAAGAELVASAATSRGLSALVAAPGELAAQQLREALPPLSGADGLVEVGSHANRFRIGPAQG